jgi:hypothetical protein
MQSIQKKKKLQMRYVAHSGAALRAIIKMTLIINTSKLVEHCNQSKLVMFVAWGLDINLQILHHGSVQECLLSHKTPLIF